ncbi:hypothetical protein SAMN05444672_101332 [Bacillus sp. OK838]|nr:hypothetical protein SAMN05444672_101332 [Bacillus sp. OK838]
MKFKVFRVGRYCKVDETTDEQRSNIRYCFFFLTQNKSDTSTAPSTYYGGCSYFHITF